MAIGRALPPAGIFGVDGGRGMGDALAEQRLAVGQVGGRRAAGAEDQFAAVGEFEGQGAGMDVAGQSPPAGASPNRQSTTASPSRRMP